MMTHRPDSHVVADVAASAVASLCNEIGWAVERVANDYGEDLLVQTSFNGALDTNRLWLQVKGTRNVSRFVRAGAVSIPISFDHALRWIRTADLVLLVLWDVNRSAGYYSIPALDISEWDALRLRKDGRRLYLPTHRILNIAELRKLGWQARFRHYANLIALALEDDRVRLDHLAEMRSTHSQYSSRIPLIAFDFLNRVGALDDNFFTSGFLGQMLVARRILSKQMNRGDRPDDGMIILAALIRHLATLSNNQPVPTRLLETCCQLIERAVNSLDLTVDRLLDPAA